MCESVPGLSVPVIFVFMSLPHQFHVYHYAPSTLSSLLQLYNVLKVDGTGPPILFKAFWLFCVLSTQTLKMDHKFKL